MNKRGGFWIELASPLKDKLDVLLEFVQENQLLGIVEKSYALQWLSSFDDMRVTKLKISVRKRKKGEAWALSGEHWKLEITINSRKDFEGTGSTFENAIINVCQNIERCVAS